MLDYLRKDHEPVFIFFEFTDKLIAYQAFLAYLRNNYEPFPSYFLFPIFFRFLFFAEFTDKLIPYKALLASFREYHVISSVHDKLTRHHGGFRLAQSELSLEILGKENYEARDDDELHTGAETSD